MKDYYEKLGKLMDESVFEARRILTDKEDRPVHRHYFNSDMEEIGYCTPSMDCVSRFDPPRQWSEKVLKAYSVSKTFNYPN